MERKFSLGCAFKHFSSMEIISMERKFSFGCAFKAFKVDNGSY